MYSSFLHICANFSFILHFFALKIVTDSYPKTLLPVALWRPGNAPNSFLAGLCPRPPWGTSQCSLRPSSRPGSRTPPHSPLHRRLQLPDYRRLDCRIPLFFIKCWHVCKPVLILHSTRHWLSTSEFKTVDHLFPFSSQHSSFLSIFFSVIFISFAD